MPAPPPYFRRITTHKLTRVADGANYFEGAVTGPNGDGSWLFAVPDGESDADATVMLSIASSSELFVGRLDLSSLGFSLWTTTPEGDFAAATANLLWAMVDLSDYGAAITDHWHIYADGSHWLSFAVKPSTEGDTETDLWLLRIETADVLTAIAAAVAAGDPTASVAAASAALVYTTKVAADLALAYPNYVAAGGVALVTDTAGTHSTNDHFIVAVLGGVAVAIWDRAESALRIMTVEFAGLGLSADVGFAGQSAGLFDVNTTGSAGRLEFDRSRRLVLAPDAAWDPYKVNLPNTLHLLETSATFDNADTTLVGLIQDTDYVRQMGSFVQVLRGDIVMVHKRIPVSGAYSDSSPVVSDWGDIVLELYSGDLTALGTPDVCLAASSTATTLGLGNRPHLSRWQRWIITTWDTAVYDGFNATDNACFLRVDRIEGA